MDVVLVVIALFAVLLAVRLVRARRRGELSARDTRRVPGEPPGRRQGSGG
jgi:hypothetical protein